jgi:hypothetical protein
MLNITSKCKLISYVIRGIINAVTNVRLRFSRRWLWRMASSGMLRRVALVITDVSGNFIFIRSVRRFLVTGNVPSSPILVTLMMEALSSSETSIPTRSTRRDIPENAILRSHRCFRIFGRTLAIKGGKLCWTWSFQKMASCMCSVISTRYVRFQISYLSKFRDTE